jgi:ubiquitin-activating enzyme E1
VDKVIDRFTFEIKNTLDTKLSGGSYKQLKKPQTLSFKSLEEAEKEPEFMNYSILYPNLNEVLHKCFSEKENDVNKIITEYFKDTELCDYEKRLIEVFSKTRDTEVVFVNSIIGGFVAQEAIKGCTGKFTPIKQYMYFEDIDCLTNTEFKQPEKVTRYYSMEKLFGKEFLTTLQNTNTFIVGSGAIGCELLKNLAMCGLSSDSGKTVITDMDTIERSNLNRQFLFRDKDIGQSKSTCASRAVKNMNPEFNIVAHENRVGVETQTVYNEEFYTSLGLVINALDNIEARKFVDSECLRYGLSLLESGTSGPKGNTQVIKNNLTESYSDTVDPPEQGFAACTIKSFPY